MEQNEIDELMKGAGSAKETAPAEDNISWDDVKEEMEQSAHPEHKTEISNVHFEELQKTKPEGKTNFNLDFIMDIPLTLTAELGRSKMLIS